MGTWLESIIEDYEYEQRLNRILLNILVVHFQCTPDLVTQEKKDEVDSKYFKWSGVKPEYAEIFDRKLVAILKDPHYYLYKHPELICKL